MKLLNKVEISKRLRKLISNPVIMNVAIVSIATMLIKIVAFYKETLVASTFGLSLLLDTFLIAVLIPAFIQNVFIGALRNIFIPNYIAELGSTNQKEEFQSLILLMVTGIMFFFTILTYFVSDLLVEIVFPNKDFEYYELVRSQLHIVLPSLFFMGYSSVIGGLLEIESKFMVSTLSGIFPAISTIIALIYFNDYLGDQVLATGFLMGNIFAFIYFIFIGYRYRLISLKWPRLNENSRTMLKQLPPKVISGFLTGVNPFVDQFFAGQLAIGSIAALNYGLKIPAFVLGILLSSVGSVLLPHFSKLVNKNIASGFKYLFKSIKVLFISTFGLTIILMVFSEPIISLLFERNSFTSEDTKVVSAIQMIILAYVPFSLCGIIIVKFLTSINKNSFMAYISVISFALNIFLNYILVKNFDLYGLALSTTFVRITVSSIYFIYTYRLFKKLY
ncbi:hypothetical protein LCGC14_1636570 [marine sediment metagenome]|uniref:Virulence factor MviN n=2 Tax=root TaxID=1 RepID=A0A831QSC5_9FLAO|nr:virulence factor MviN [Pricia antarctica]